MKKAFTTIEILATVAFLCVAFVLFINQQNQVNQRLRDQERNASINSLYFNLKDVYFKHNGYYPEFMALIPQFLAIRKKSYLATLAQIMNTKPAAVPTTAVKVLLFRPN